MDTTLTPADRERLEVIHSCIKGIISNAEAAARLGLKKRQVQNLKRAVMEYGESGIVHAGRGKPSNRRIGEDTRSAVVAFFSHTKHHDFKPTFAQEQLHKRGIAHISHETVRRIMIEAGLWKARKRKGPQIHREWRERRAMKGELVQFDGCYHDWLENGTTECLLAAIDDATNEVVAKFEENEGVYAVFRFWRAYIEEHGRPVALYMDKFSTYKINHKSAVDNKDLLTQFRRAMLELGIEVICANSPQAKGRIERLFETLQDRFVKELRLSDVRDLDAAGRFLHDVYLPEHNARFAVSARTEGNAHRPLTDTLRARLPSIFSVQSKRHVNNDFTLQFKSQWYQLVKQQSIRVYPNDTVTIEERLDGTLHIRLHDTYLAYQLISKLQHAIRPRLKTQKPRKRHKPAPDHPWRRASLVEKEKREAKQIKRAH